MDRVVCAIDCGLALNPDIVAAQMEGGIVYGLSAALKGAITLEGGRVKQSNFHDYPVLRMSEMPRVEVHIVESTDEPPRRGRAGGAAASPRPWPTRSSMATGTPVRRLPLALGVSGERRPLGLAARRAPARMAPKSGRPYIFPPCSPP